MNIVPEITSAIYWILTVGGMASLVLFAFILGCFYGAKNTLQELIKALSKFKDELEKDRR